MSTTIQLPASDNGPEIMNEATLRTKFPVSKRTLKNWRDEGSLPYIRLPKSRLIWYHWPSVQAALLRQQNTATK